MAKDKIIFAGGIFRDLVTVAPRFPQPGETLFGREFFTGFGGKVANQCIMGRLLGADVAMVGKLGDDDHGKAYRDNFVSHGVDVSHLGTVANMSSGIASIFVNSVSGENMIIVVSGANDRVMPENMEQGIANLTLLKLNAVLPAPVLMLDMIIRT